tara:strand:+ start:149 stop:1408 length:1260 start_codon:yes stop_codon:yes gene_type:complete
MENNFTEINNCRLCYSSDLEFLFSLGDHPLLGVYVKPKEPDPIIVPVNLVFCNACKFVQLGHTVNSKLIYDNYWYLSNINKTMREHLKNITMDIEKMMSLQKDDICLDIGCNDGTLLKSYLSKEITKIGIDPNKAINNINSNNIIGINDYFSAKKILPLLYGKKLKVITTISMFYDLDDPNSFIKDIVKLMAPDGIWIVEMNYTGEMIKNCGYDMISHEHIGYYTLNVFDKLVRKHNLYVNHVEFNSINGGSIRIYVSFSNIIKDSVSIAMNAEFNEGLHLASTYKNFSDRIIVSKNNLVEKLQKIKSQNKSIYIYGASNRGNTILLYCGLNCSLISGAAERNPLKFGLETVGSRIPIVSEKLARDFNPDYFLILPYGFIGEFIKREYEYLKGGGRFLIPIPELEEIYVSDDKILREKV